jgi:hypothetical protein
MIANNNWKTLVTMLASPRKWESAGGDPKPRRKKTKWWTEREKNKKLKNPKRGAWLERKTRALRARSLEDKVDSEKLPTEHKKSGSK